MADSPAGRGSKNRFENLGKRVDERLGSTIPRIEEELKKIISYLNDEVVPHLRQDSAQALRSSAQRLSKLAEYLDAQRADKATDDR